MIWSRGGHAKKSLLDTSRRQVGAFVAYWLAHRYSVLFYALFLTLIAFPLLAALGLDLTPLFGFVSLSLAVALIGMSNRHLSRLLLALLFGLLAFLGVAGALDLHRMMPASTAALVLLGFIAGVETVGVAMKSSQVDAELLYAALSVYLLIGLLFAALHCAAALASRDAYLLPQGELISLHTGIYFSFSTQTTLGYGDFLPKSDLVRGLAMVQGILGQLYLSVMVARLVGLYVSSTARRGEDDDEVGYQQSRGKQLVNHHREKV